MGRNRTGPDSKRGVSMKGSTVIPWLYFGPLLVMMGCHLVYTLTDRVWAARVAQGMLAWVILFSLVLFLLGRFRR